MAFVSWAAEYTRFKNALSAMSTGDIIRAGWTDGQGQTVTFKRLADLVSYENFLKSRMDEESNSSGRRTTPFSFGWGGRG